MANLREAFEYAAKNPNSQTAKDLESMAVSGALDVEAKRYGIDLTPFKPVTPEPEEKKGRLVVGSTTPDLSLVKGIAKGAGSTVKGIADIGDKFLNLTGAQESQPVYQKGTPEYQAVQQSLEPVNQAERLGKTAEQIAEIAIPGTKVAKATQTAPLLAKATARGLTSGSIVAAQKGEFSKDALIAGAVDAALPVVGKAIKPIKNLVSRVLKGTGVALSGASGAQIDEIVNNPEKAKILSRELAKSGNDKVLESNVRKIINGVSKLNKDNSVMYQKGIESLAKTDIKPDVFRSATQNFLDQYGIYSDDGQRVFQNVEFTDPKNIQKASNLIDKLQNTELDGKALRKLANEIDTSAFKTVGTDAERLSYNQFIKDLSSAVDSAINQSTDKLKEINSSYSQTKQLTEAIQKELGNVDYKNLSEVIGASKKLETLFSKQGLAPKVIDDFLAKIGATDLKTSEAVRQISNKELATNTVGANPFEALRNISAAIVTPKMVKNTAIVMSITDKKASAILKALSPTARAAFIKALTQTD